VPVLSYVPVNSKNVTVLLHVPVNNKKVHVLLLYVPVGMVVDANVPMDSMEGLLMVAEDVSFFFFLCTEALCSFQASLKQSCSNKTY
jgi:hypothetical protein